MKQMNEAYNLRCEMLWTPNNSQQKSIFFYGLELTGDYKEYLDEGSDIIHTNNDCYHEEKVLQWWCWEFLAHSLK